jgi:hypothetical protein
MDFWLEHRTSERHPIRRNMKKFIQSIMMATTAVVVVAGVQQASGAGAVATYKSWPMHRGGPELLGVAPGRLPASLKLLWKFKTDDVITSSAAIVDGKVYVGSHNGKVYALNFTNGGRLWEHETDGPIESSPLVLGDKVYIGSSDGFLYALDAATGKPAWKFETEDKILGAPNWMKSPDRKGTWIVFGSYDFRLYAVDSETGKQVWNYESENYINGSAAVSDGRTVFGGCDALLHVIALKDGSQLKEIDAEAYIAGSAAVTGGARLCRPLRERVSLLRHREGRDRLALRRKPFSLLRLARGDQGPDLRRRARQAGSLPGSQDRKVDLEVCHPRQGGQLAGRDRRQGGLRIGGRPRLHHLGKGREGIVELRNRRAHHGVARHRRQDCRDRLRRRDGLCVRGEIGRH